MEDENKKENEEPSTSKVNEPKVSKHSRERFSDEDLGYDERSTDSWGSDRSYDRETDRRSHRDVPSDKMQIHQPVVGKTRPPRRLKRLSRRQPRRIEKRKRSHRRMARRDARRHHGKQGEKKRDQSSVCTIFTRLSRANSHAIICKFCGHRTCRRLMYRKKRPRMKKLKRIRKKTKPKISECIQVGSRSLFLSPLFIGAIPEVISAEDPQKDYLEITPEMIHQVLRRGTMWRQAMSTDAILASIKNSYPVNPDSNELHQELSNKLEIAAMIGIVSCVGNELWRLSCHLERRNLSTNHVTLFWELYRDTMKPIDVAKTIPLRAKLRNQDLPGNR